MNRPQFHSCTWSDMEDRGSNRHPARRLLAEDPESLKDKELHLWVTYPEAKQQKCRKGNRSRSGRKGLKLWAVMIIEGVERQTEYSFEVTLRRIFKEGDRLIRVWVSNDPGDQTEDAAVFGYVSPDASQLTPLEERLCHIAAKRVYEAIAATWGQSAAGVGRMPVSVACQDAMPPL